MALLSLGLAQQGAELETGWAPVCARSGFQALPVVFR